MKLSFLYVPVSDLDEAVDFYRGRLGLEEAWQQGDSTVAFWTPDKTVQLMVDTDGYPAGPMYLVDDVDAWAAAHDQVPVRVPTYGIPGGAVAGFEDPSGNVFHVFDQTEND